MSSFLIVNILEQLAGTLDIAKKASRCNTSTISLFIFVSFFFEDSFKATKGQINDITIDILISWRYSGESNSKRQVEIRCKSNLFQTEPS